MKELRCEMSESDCVRGEDKANPSVNTRTQTKSELEAI